jgi:hypothetical protein
MNDKTPSNFSNHDEWLSDVRENISSTWQCYALACGRTELFKSFYQVRNQTFPVEFAEELQRIHTLREPERTTDLESLNGQIFSSLTEFLFNQAQPKVFDADSDMPTFPRQKVQKLLNHLIGNNPYFALWAVYKTGIGANLDAESWENYLSRELGPGREDDIVFARAMAELDKLLLYFHDRNFPLPKYFFERCRLLHYLRGPGRMLQTRALLNTLAAEIEACAST